MSSQAEFWNEAGGLAWVAGQEFLDAQLAPFGALALDAAAVAAGESVLDVGCGCGATTAELATLVGPAGRVVGLDVSAPMLARARERVSGRPVELRLGDAATVPLEAGAFDVCVSRFGVMFFDDPGAAFGHLRGALAPGGRIAWVVWQSTAVNPWVTVPAAAVADLTGPLPFGGPGEPGPFSLDDPGHVRGLLDGAGFAGVELAGYELAMVVGGGLPLDDAVAFTVDHGPLRRVLDTTDADTRAVATERLTAALAPYASPSGVVLPAAVWVVTGRAG
jgi:SAM-dependent methyltransferase